MACDIREERQPVVAGDSYDGKVGGSMRSQPVVGIALAAIAAAVIGPGARDTQTWTPSLNRFRCAMKAGPTAANSAARANVRAVLVTREPCGDGGRFKPPRTGHGT